ncbi:MAG: response regulator transcription factor [Myxococcota bacterium]
MRTLVVEDQPRFLKSVLTLLRGAPDFVVSGVARSAAEARAQLDAEPGWQLVLLDLGLPDEDGLRLVPAARRAGAEVVVWTVDDDPSRGLQALRAGAAGYLVKGARAEEVLEGLRAVAAGGAVLQPRLARALLETFGPEPRDGAARVLSPREREILEVVAKGFSNPEIASILGLSAATVRTHLEHVFEKLDVSSRVEAVTEAIRRGIIAV